MVRMKVIVIGPEEAGKTLISNIIADMADNDFTQYEPTEGVRILEVDSLTSNSLSANVEVELWDCGGSSRYQSCWPVIQLDVDGVIFVYNPEAKEQLSEFELFYDYFVIQSGLSDIKCVIFVNLRSDVEESSITLPNRCKGVTRKFFNAASCPNKIKSEFHCYIETLTGDERRSFKYLN